MFEVGAIRARLGADVEELGFKRYDKLHQSAQRQASRPVVATLGGALEEGDFRKYEREVAEARREATTPVEVTLSGDLDNVVFGKYDKAVSGARQKASKPVEVTLGADLDDGGFDDWEAELAKARTESKAPVEAELGADVNRRGFRAYERHVREAEQLGREREALKAKLGADVDEAGFRAYRRAVRGAEGDSHRLGRAVSNMGRRIGDAIPSVNFQTRIPFYLVTAFVAALAAGIPVLVAFSGALGPILGQLAAIPGLATIAGGALVTAMLGLKGVIGTVGEAWEMEQTAASDAVDTSRAAEAAAESVRGAQEAAADTERDVTRARRELTEATEDQREELSRMRLEAEGAVIAESEAAQALRRARQQLIAAETDPRSTALDIREAETAIDRARLGLREARGERADLEREVQAADQQGVRRSDRVVAARERLADAERAAERATRRVSIAARDANRTLTDASGGAEKFQEEMAKLSPAGQNFVRLIQNRFFPMLRGLRAEAQEGLLPGLGDGLVAASANFPVIEDMVRNYSDALGDAAREQGELFGSQNQGRDMATIFGFGETLIRRSSHATADWTRGLTHLMVAAEPLYDWLGRINMRLADSFESWAEGGRQSGRLERFFRVATKNTELFVGTLWDTGRALINIGGIGRRVWGQDMLGGIRDVAREFREWTESVEGERSIERYFVRWRRRWEAITEYIGSAVSEYRRLKRQGMTTTEALATILTERLGEAFGEVVAIAVSQGPRVARGFAEGFLKANVWGKLIIGAWLISKLGGGRAINAIGSRIGGRVADSFVGSMIAGVEAKQGALRGVGRRAGRWIGRGLLIGIAAGAVLGYDEVKDELADVASQINDALFGDKVGGFLSDIRKRLDPTGGGYGGRDGGEVTPRGIQRFALGGPVMPLPPGEDTWAALRYGEFVMKREAVQRVGLARLRAMNEGQGGSGAVDAVAGDLMTIAAAGAAAGQSAAEALTEGLAGGRAPAKRATGELRKDVGGELDELSDDARVSAKRLRDGLVDNVGEASVAADREVRSMRRDVTRQIDGLADEASTRTRRLATTFDGEFGEMHESAGATMRGIVGVTGRRLAETEGVTRTSTRGIRNVLADSYESMNRAVSTGLGYVQRATSKALVGLGGDPVRLEVPRPGKLATGGYVGVPGERGIDDQLYLLGRGEAVLNHHQQSRADDLLGYFGTSLNDIIGSDQRLHYAATGKASEKGRGGGLTGSFDVDGAGPGFVPMMLHLNKMFGPIYVMSGMRAGSTILGTGRPSNHGIGQAVDITAPGGEYATQSSPMTGALGARMDALHSYMGRHYRPILLDFLWRTMTGGNHYNHIHAGVDRNWSFDPDNMRQFISGLPGGGFFGSIPKVKVKGDDGPLRGIAQRSINKVRDRADKFLNKRMARLMPKGSPAGGLLHSAYDGPLNRTFKQHGHPPPPGSAQLSSGQVRTAARAGGIRPPDDRHAEEISRGESTNFPGVVSWDGGYGLTQITPSAWPGTSPLHGVLGKLGGIGQMLNPVKNMTMMRVMMGYAQRETGNRFKPWYGTKYLTAGRGRPRRAAGGKKGGIGQAFTKARSRINSRIKKAGGPGEGDFTLGKYEGRIEGLRDDYQRWERRYNVSEEQLVLAPGDRGYDESYAISIGRFETDDEGNRVGLNYIDERAIKARADELTHLIGIQRKIVMTYTRYMKAVERIIETYRRSRARLAKVLAKAKPNRRKRYKDDIESMARQQGGWESALAGLGNQRFDEETNLIADRQERDELRPTAEDSLDAPTEVETDDADTDAQLAQLQEKLRISQEEARLATAAVTAFSGPGDIGAGGPNALSAAQNPQGVPGYQGPGTQGYEIRSDGRMYPVGGSEPGSPFDGQGTPSLVQNNYMLSPSDPGVLEELGRSTVAGIGYQGAQGASRERIAS